MCKIRHKNTNRHAFYLFFVFTFKNNYYLCKRYDAVRDYPGCIVIHRKTKRRYNR